MTNKELRAKSDRMFAAFLAHKGFDSVKSQNISKTNKRKPVGMSVVKGSKTHQGC